MLIRKKRMRYPTYDYREAGWYFVTIVAHRRLEIFGEIVDAQVVPSLAGEIVSACWADIPAHSPHVALDAFVGMPNHVHGLLHFVDFAGAGPQTHAGASGALGAVIGSFKAAATRQIRRAIPTHTGRVWQESFYEHVVRGSEGVERVRSYIESNPERWHLDRENARRVGTDAFDRWLCDEGERPLESSG